MIAVRMLSLFAAVVSRYHYRTLKKKGKEHRVTSQILQVFRTGFDSDSEESKSQVRRV